MKIKVNGNNLDFQGTLLDLIKKFNLNKNSIVAERNGEVVHREDYGAVRLDRGDVIELVRFVGGG